MRVVPDPENGSYTAWPGLLLFSIGRRMHSTGFCVPCVVSASWARELIDHRVVCLRSPAQWPVPPWRTAYQQGSCCQW